MSTGTKVTTETEMDTCKYTVKYISLIYWEPSTITFAFSVNKPTTGPAINCMIIDIIIPNPTVIITA